jgi:hypothetical protein
MSRVRVIIREGKNDTQPTLRLPLGVILFEKRLVAEVAQAKLIGIDPALAIAKATGDALNRIEDVSIRRRRDAAVVKLIKIGKK